MTLLRPVHRRLATPGCLVVLLALLLCAPAALSAQRKRSAPKAHRPPALSLYAPSAGLYKGEPEYSFLWPFSQALAASVSVAHIPGQQARLEGELHALAAGLQVYSSSPPPGETTATGASTATTARSFDDVTAPPVGPGGDSFYDDNEWVGIELARMYELDHSAAAL